ncbi:MAG: alpha/beta hydrolase [Deltaproteobacteria bacterium]|nr:alpha/beta hydrolase [Deltaproteobacteria bacterium]
MPRLLLIALVVAWAAPAAAEGSAAPTAFTVEVTGKGPPVILVPGLGCPASVWDTTIAHLLGSREVHTITAAGFAGTASIGKPPVATVREQLAAYIRDKKLERPIVIGHSMGGFLALWLAEAEPELVGGVVVVDAGATMGGGDPAWEPVARKQRDAYLAMPRTEFEATLRKRFSAMFGDPAKHEAIIAAVTRSDQKAYAAAYWELNTIDLRPQLGKIRAPVLAIFAASASHEYHRAQLKGIARLDVVVVAKSKHFVMQDQPAEFFRALDAFLAKR